MNTQSALAVSTAGAMTSYATTSTSTAPARPIIAPPSATTPLPVVAPISVRLDRSNYMLWRALALPNFSGARLHGFLDGTAIAQPLTVTEGDGDAEKTVTNPEYEEWWTLDRKVLGLLLGWMTEEIAAQLIGCTTAAAAWVAVAAMFGVESHASVRHLRRQIQALRKGTRPSLST